MLEAEAAGCNRKAAQAPGSSGKVLEGGTSNAAPAPGTSTVDPAKAAQQKNAAVSGLQKLKAAGVNIPTSMNQAAQTALKTANDPAASSTQQDKNVGLGLGAEMERLVATGNPSQVQQVANAIKQAKLSGAK